MYLDLFKRYVPKLKRSSGSQYIGLCPHHDDTEASLSINMDKGVWYCHACGANGNAYMMAKQLGHENPTQFIDDNNTQNTQNPYNPYTKCNVTDVTLSDKKENIQYIQDMPKKDYTSLIKKFKSNLLDNIDVYPPIWDKTLIDDLDIGYCTTHHQMVYAYDNSGYKIHNTTSSSGLTKRWYLCHKISDYSTDKTLYICEGEKDTLTLISLGYQAISISGGCKSMPSDEMLELIKDFKIVICYDNDNAGRDGAKNLAQKLLNKDVSIIQWAKHLPNKFDVTDAFEKDDSASEFYDALKNSKRITKQIKYGGLKMIDNNVAMNMHIKPRTQIIDNILPEKSQVIIGGTTGANKSFMAMQMGMSIANNEKEFLGFKINVNGLRVLYCDTECGEQTLVERYQKLIQNFDWKEDSIDKFRMLTNTDGLSKVYDDLEEAVIEFKPDIVIIDCLYNTTMGADISVNAKLVPTLNRITKIKKDYDLSIILVHHMNKGNHELGLVTDRMSGGSSLQNWSEHINLVTRTNASSTRLFKIGKSRHIDYPECYYALRWDSDKCMLVNDGIIEDWKPLLINSDKKKYWSLILRDLPSEFTSEMFTNIVNSKGKSDRTARQYLTSMVQTKAIERIHQGKYKKGLKFFESEE